MSLNITRPVYQLRDVAGVARAGWMLRFKKINSDDDFVVYEDIALTVPACQPVILNNQGWASVYAGEGQFTVREYDADGVLQDCFDMQGAGGGGSGSFSLVPTVQAMRELPAGSTTYVVAQGYDAYGDGCGGEFDWIPTATNPDDGVTWFAPISTPEQGRYRRRNATALTTRMAGDPGNLDNSYETLTRLAAAAQPGDNVIFAPGLYKLAASQEVEFGINVGAFAEYGAKIDTADASAIRFLGTFAAPVTEVFTGELNVSFGNKQPLAFPEWLGAHADNGDTDNTDAFLALFASGALLYTLPGKNNYAVETDVSPSIPGNAIFMASSKIYFTTGPVDLVRQGLFSKNGYLDFAGIKAAVAEFVSLTLSGNLDVDGDGNFGGSGNFQGSLTATQITSESTIEALSAIKSIFGNVEAGNNVIAGAAVSAGTTVTAALEVVSGRHVQAKAGTGTLDYKAAGAGARTIGTGDATLPANSLTDNNSYIKIVCSGTCDNTSPTYRVTVGGQTVFETNYIRANSGPDYVYVIEVLVFRTGPTTSYSVGTVTIDAQSSSSSDLIVPCSTDTRTATITWANINAVSHFASANAVKALTMFEVYP